MPKSKRFSRAKRHPQGPNIIIVDSDRLLAMILGHKLYLKGYSVDVIFDPVEALEKMKERAYDLMVLELLLRDIDGYELLRRIESTAGLKRPARVLVLTSMAEGDIADEKKALSLGAAGFMLKYKTTVTEVIRKIRKMLGGR